MRRRRFFGIFVVFILFVGLFTVFGEEPTDEEFSKTKEEYMPIFKNIPVLFEYLLVALQDKPEILETDNPMTFNDMTVNNGKEIDKRDTSDRKEVSDNDGPVARIADDIFDEVEGLDDPASESTGDDEESSESAEIEEGDVKISPEEIAEKFMMVEQLLEDFNKSKK